MALHGKENTTININLRATDGNMKRFDIEKEIGTTLGQKGATVATMTADLMLRLADMKEEVETQMCTDRMDFLASCLISICNPCILSTKI